MCRIFETEADSGQICTARSRPKRIGPILLGLDRAVQICPLSASVSKILHMATFCAYDRPLVEIEV